MSEVKDQIYISVKSIFILVLVTIGTALTAFMLSKLHLVCDSTSALFSAELFYLFHSLFLICYWDYFNSGYIHVFLQIILRHV